MTSFGDGFRRSEPSRPLERCKPIIALLSLSPSLQLWALCGYLDPNCDRGMNQKCVFYLRSQWSGGCGSVLPHYFY